MAIIATGSKTIIDLSDGKSLSAYLGSNQPRVQINDVNKGTFSPDWTTDAGKLVIEPVVYANQTRIELSDKNLSIVWKRKTGSGSASNLETGETVSDNILTVTANKLTGAAGNVLTYITEVKYTDPETDLPINAVAQIDFALVTTGEHAKTAWISGEQVFKYDANGNATPAQITLTANLQNVTMSQWQYKKDDGSWAAYPTTSDNASISGTSLIVKPTHAVFNGTSATIRIVTSDPNVGDSTSLYKVSDGTDGQPGAAGSSASVVFLTNENITFAGNASGQVAATTKTCNVVAYTGTTKVQPKVGEITGAPTGSGMTITTGSPVGNEIPITITVAAGSMLGGSGQQQGELLVPITSPVSTTLKIQWSKVNTGATGQDGKSAVIFALYAPDGEVFQNHQGELTIATQAYIGSQQITSGATYAWSVYSGGKYEPVKDQTGKDQTGSTLTVKGTDVTGIATYKCTMTYGGQTYTDVITLTDKTDNYQATIESTGGDIFKNTQGTSTLICRLFQNGTEVDTDGAGHTYKWYRMDKDGNAMNSGAVFYTGKSVNIDGNDVDVKTTFVCEVE